jgi:transposase-like protein
MTETQQTNNTTTITPTRINKADMIRELITSGVSPAQVARDVGCKPQYVYGVIAYERKKVAKLKAKAKSTPKRKYTKSGKYAKKPTTPMVDTQTMLELDRNRLKDELFDLREFNEQLIKDIQEATKPRIQYIEIEVPQPFSHYTFWQRLRILFLGSAA